MTVSDLPSKGPPENEVVIVPPVGKQHPAEWVKGELIVVTEVYFARLCCTRTVPLSSFLPVPCP